MVLDKEANNATEKLAKNFVLHRLFGLSPHMVPEVALDPGVPGVSTKKYLTFERLSFPKQAGSVARVTGFVVRGMAHDITQRANRRG